MAMQLRTNANPIFNSLKLDQLDKPEVESFLQNWDENYFKSASDINLFKPELPQHWTLPQKQYFIRTFYHARGHFSELLWHMGSFAPSAETKEMILTNTRDEFGKHGLSHEQLYQYFAKGWGVDLSIELLDQKWYLPCIREYIQGQLRWLMTHDWDHRLAAFAAIERLDNIDYLNLRNIAISMGTERKYLTFFNVLVNADHFDNIFATSFQKLWLKSPKLVITVFEFIKKFQLDMWKELSDAIFSYS